MIRRLELVLSSLVVHASLAAQVVRVDVGRSEAAAVIGLDEQLAMMRLVRGQLQVQRGDAGSSGSSAPDELVLQVEVRWSEPAPKEPKGFRPARVSASDVVKASAWLARAMAGEGRFAADEVAALDGAAGPRLCIDFVTPKTGRSKARQFRHARRIIAAALIDLGLLESLPAPWPEGFAAQPALCLYDAEGVGGSGCENLERVVGATTLGLRLLHVCPEDIREGGLVGMAAVIFPGGSGGGIAKALQPAGVERVRQFVGDGGGYLGICAGAYFAGAGLDSYAALLPWRHTQPWAKGASELDVELTAAGRQLLGTQFAKFRTRYHNGPVYPDVLAQSRAAGAEREPLVLANFASPSKDSKGVVHESMVGTPAIVADRFGKGRVLLISPHPESHDELNALVARAIGWTIDLAPARVRVR